MDESWRMRMGMATRPKHRGNLPRRRSTEETSAARAVFGADCELLGPEDFADVFGGPPRTVLSRQFSTGEFSKSSNPFYEEIFRPPQKEDPARSGGRNLPEFRIPAIREREEGFYSDIFGKEDGVRRSRSRSKPNSKSKSNSSSVLSSEELSPLRPADVANGDSLFSSFASKLRWSSSTMMPEDQHPWQQEMPAFPTDSSSYINSRFTESEFIDNFRSSQFGFSRRVPSPEIISLEPNSYGSVKASMDDQELNSPSSVVSSLCQDAEPKATSTVRDEVFLEQEMEQEDDEVMSSFVIEINVDHREGTEEALGIDEAIAWAKEKFHTHCPEKNWSKHDQDQSAEAKGFSDRQIDGVGSGKMGFPVEEEPNIWVPRGGESQEKNENREMEQLDENIRLWSAGKEDSIRLLLSSLHHILWPTSGWFAIPLTSLVESSQVKKAYQKARLCLHPDKLQQRGATLTQKYVAEKAFSILQEAWAANISQDDVLG
ncbi:uncharacterized protein LOC127795194 isoform X2 [Diospyros lotus]|uniref:uncharacterized protein LOC127795194 isoform X2 n=1 Tax=Diospyros lotus TaxID=55363 RepID=UPI00225BB345|nr:uncharacterized protein LOC127795194 isoform X2 [Diospyros lotus]